ncbi:MAG: excinuclease ABC subunit B, partial [Spirochaetia bacterium]|nr:excinuclease ABC subunit B [Spirochaetia bacterium]
MHDDIHVDGKWGGEAVSNIHGDVSYRNKPFRVVSEYEPSGDQAQAIEALSSGLRQGDRFQTLKGVTGSGKTYT